MNADPPLAAVRAAVALALAEDLLPLGDLTAALVPEGAVARAMFRAREAGVVAGRLCVVETYAQLSGEVGVDWRLADGSAFAAGDVLGVVEGPLAPLLTGERTALNFLQRLSGVSTLTARCVQAVEGTGVRILDTRKTTPGLRGLEKAAVKAGGGTNHRSGLYDEILIKENHAAIAGGVGAAVLAARRHAPDLPLEVECSTMAEIDEALKAGATRILLDNMNVEQLRAAVTHVDGRASLEASGGITLQTLREVASTGLQFISVGALTHSAPALDLSLILQPLT